MKNMKNMKKIVYVVMLSLLTISFNSCDKDDSVNDILSSVIKSSMTCEIDGASWSSVTRITKLKSGAFIIAGTSITGQVLTVTINGDTEGDYELSLLSQSCLATYTLDASNLSETSVSKSGSVSLTDVDTVNKTISGTFNFVLIDSSLILNTTITDGTFSELTYTEETDE